MNVNKRRHGYVLVKPSYDRRGSVTWTAITAFVLGAASYYLPNKIFVEYFFFTSMLSRTMLTIVGLVTSIVPIVIAAILAFRFLNRCRSPLFVYVIGHIFGTSALLGMYWSFLIAVDDLYFNKSMYVFAAMIVTSCIVLGAISGGLLLLVQTILIGVQGDIIEQDGSLCWVCGYVVGSPAQHARCPECGEIIEQPSLKRPTSAGVFSGFRKRFAILFGLTFLLGIILPVTLHVKATEKTVATLQGDGELVGMGMINFQSQNPPVLGPFWECLGSIREVPGHPQMVLAVCASSDRMPEQPCMQLQLGATSPYRFEYGDPVVVVNLDCNQAEWVKTNGVPQSLVDAMVEAAEKNNWSPTLTTPGQFGRFVILEGSTHFDSEMSFDNP